MVLDDAELERHWHPGSSSNGSDRMPIGAERAVFLRIGPWLLLLGLASCRRDPKALTDGASWLTHTPPPALAGRVSRYDERQFFGLRNDDHGWERVARYTLRADLADPDAGCSFVDSIAGNWSRSGSSLIVTTSKYGSGSREAFDCPRDPAPRSVERPANFTRAESEFTLKDRTLRLESQFGASPAYSLELTREN